MEISSEDPCPCGGKKFGQCCSTYLLRQSLPETAEQLMRSRYTAYCFNFESYLLDTWHPSKRPAALNLQGDQTRWLGLEVKRHQQLPDNKATVEFVARYKEGGGPAVRMHEVSNFIKEGGQWFYVDGQLNVQSKK